MSKTGKQPIKNAAEIIEKFGGIRPMASKTNVAVTTIQGWKKRDTIPGTRRTVILEAAANYNIDLSEFLDEAPSLSSADGNATIETPGELENVIEIPQTIIEDQQDRPENTQTYRPQNRPPAETEKREAEAEEVARPYTELHVPASESKSFGAGAMIAALIAFVILAAVIATFLPDFNHRGEDIASLEDTEQKQTAFKGLVPENWVEQLSELKEQAQNAKEAVGETMTQMGTTVANVQQAGKELMQDGNIEERVVQLQSYVSEIADGSGVYGLLSRFEGMEQSVAGQQTLDNSVFEISNLLSGVSANNDGQINNLLAAARSQSDSLNQTLGSVPKNELKAATMLLAMTQVRSALNRDEKAFDNDLNLLMNMVGEDNTDLLTALEKLAPHSKSGILSANGLQKEFRTLAGDVVAASLSGEDVSFGEKASARFNDILEIEKDGELVTGTDTQAKVKKAEQMMQYGNIEEALAFLRKHLNDKELAPLKPWINKVEAFLNSRKVKVAIQKFIDAQAGAGLLGGKDVLKDIQ